MSTPVLLGFTEPYRFLGTGERVRHVVVSLEEISSIHLGHPDDDVGAMPCYIITMKNGTQHPVGASLEEIQRHIQNALRMLQERDQQLAMMEQQP